MFNFKLSDWEVFFFLTSLLLNNSKNLVEKKTFDQFFYIILISEFNVIYCVLHKGLINQNIINFLESESENELETEYESPKTLTRKRKRKLTMKPRKRMCLNTRQSIFFYKFLKFVMLILFFFEIEMSTGNLVSMITNLIESKFRNFQGICNNDNLFFYFFDMI